MTPKNLKALVNNGFISQKEIDDKIRRILGVCLRMELYSNGQPPSVNWQKHAKLAKQIALEGSVLLKNENNVLPLQLTKSKSLAILGCGARPTPISGGGAALVKENANSSIYDSLQEKFADNCQLTFLESAKEADLGKFDIIVAVTGFNKDLEGEGFDRPFQLPLKEEKMLCEITSAHPRTVVLLLAGGGVDMSNWVERAAAILHCWYPGEEGGLAVAELLLGEVNPSGKLPISIERKWQDSPAAQDYDPLWAEQGFSAYNVAGKGHQIRKFNYSEGIFCGYRHYDRKQFKPLYPFGFGLSYTSFTLNNFSSDKTSYLVDDTICLTGKVKNTGNRKGQETIQVYLHNISNTLPRPVKELKAFAKIELDKGRETKVQINIPIKNLRYYDPEQKAWCYDYGKFKLEIANSSRSTEGIFINLEIAENLG